MRGEEGICLDDFGTDHSLDGGFDFGLCARVDTVERDITSEKTLWLKRIF